MGKELKPDATFNPQTRSGDEKRKKMMRLTKVGGEVNDELDWFCRVKKDRGIWLDADAMEFPSPRL